VGSMVSATGMKTSPPHGKECGDISSCNPRRFLPTGGPAMTSALEVSSRRGLFQPPIKILIPKAGTARLVAVWGIS
jgi:hypothetical protein